MTPAAHPTIWRDGTQRLLRSVWTTIAAALLALVMGVLAAAPAHAHAELLGTDPTDGAVRAAAPELATLTFNEVVSPIEGAMKLFGPTGDMQVLTATARDTQVRITMPPGMAQGSYSLAWRVVSADGHPISGLLIFHIGQPSTAGGQAAQTEPDTSVVGGALIAVTALQYLGLLLAVGMTLFGALVLRGESTRATGLARRVLLAGWGAALLGSLLLVPVQALRIVGASWTSLFSASTWLPGVLSSTLIAAALVTVAAVGSQLLARRPGWAAAVASVAVVAPILVGHTRTMTPIWAMVASDAVHLLGASLWLGGLVSLVLLVTRGGPASGTTVATLVARFSGVALISVAVLAASGLVMATLVTGDLTSVPETTYGKTLLVKVGLVVTAVVLAAWNRFRLVPMISAEPDRRSGWQKLRRVLAGEAIILVLVVALTGALTQLTPHAHVAAVNRSTTAEVQVTSQNLEVDGQISPLVVGKNTFEFTLTHAGAVITDQQVEVSVTLPDQDLGPLTATVTPVPQTPGRFTAEFYLPTAGIWNVQVSVRVSQFEQPVAVVKVPIR